MNFRDGTSRRYTKNIRRIDKELRNEASDIHDRQPYAVVTAIVFMPEGICTDAGRRGRTSFTHNYGVLQDRVGRVAQTDKNDLFEAIWIGLYCIEKGPCFGDVRYVEVECDKEPATAPSQTNEFEDCPSPQLSVGTNYGTLAGSMRRRRILMRDGKVVSHSHTSSTR